MKLRHQHHKSASNHSSTPLTLMYERQNFKLHWKLSSKWFCNFILLIIIIFVTSSFHVHAHDKPCLDSSIMTTKDSESLFSPSDCSNNELTLIENSWESSKVNNMVVKIVLEEKLGVCVHIRRNTTVIQGLELINTIGNEKAIVILEFWKSGRTQEYRFVL